MISTATQALGRRAQAMLDALAAISADDDRINRLYLTPEYRRAANLVAGWMADIGLEVHEDALASVHGRLAPTLAGGSNRRLLIASHIDTVIDAGKYDGCLGVVAGLIAVDEIRGRGLRLPFGIEVVAFGDEEGVRFPTTLSSSTALAGAFDAASLDKPGIGGVSLRQALTAFGKDPGEIAAAAADPASLIGYVEVHIEQGPVLEHEGEALGVVTSIAGQSRYRITVSGEAGHAGTVPMGLRHDAMMATAEICGLIEAEARAGNAAHGLVATVGTLQVKPGAINVIPAEVSFTLDIRAASDAPRLAAIETIRAGIDGICARRGTRWRWERFLDQPTTPMNDDLQALLTEAVTGLGGKGRRLSSGAGHDAMALAPVTDTAMLFVRSRGGISHNPAEFSSVDDMGLAIEALIRFIEGLARREIARAG